MKVYPLKFEPIFKERIWGGQSLARVFGKDIPAGRRIGESWELADLPGDKSRIVNGELCGMTIDRVIEKLGAAITGGGDYRPPFPLLIKILDAEDMLSVQVHPDAQACRRMGKGEPKTECWYIIDAKAGAYIYKGLKKGVAREQFARAIKDGTCERLLNKVNVRPGECHFLAAGTCHAIGAGLLIAEIQTPSDTTYRVFDWNRVDETGKPRPLHIEEAMESIGFDKAGEKLEARTAGRLVDSEAFKVDKRVCSGDTREVLSSGEMKVLVIIKGRGRISGGGEDTVINKGDVVLVPADFEGAAEFGEEGEYLIVAV